MNFEVEYQDSKPTKVMFEPDPTNSGGTYNHRLLGAAMGRLCPSGWSWDGKYLSTKPLPGDQLDSMVEQAQAKVTDIMDSLDEFQGFLHVIKEYNAQSNPK